jgi:hypothetical protein
MGKKLSCLSVLVVVIPFGLRRRRTGSCWGGPGRLGSGERRVPAGRRRWPEPTPGSPFGSTAGCVGCGAGPFDAGRDLQPLVRPSPGPTESETAAVAPLAAAAEASTTAKSPTIPSAFKNQNQNH